MQTIPRLAIMNALAGFGRCTTAVAIPVVSVLGVQACPVPVSIMSNHLGFPVCYRDDYTPHLHDYIDAWKQLELTFDGLYCGSLGSLAQIAVTEEFLDFFQPKVFLLDPVMGDHGKAYSPDTAKRCPHLKKLAARADILTPNLTEACLLTDTPYREAFSEAQLHALCEKLAALCPKANIVITGIPQETQLTNLVLTPASDGSFQQTKITCNATGACRPGTGDIFASILAADTLLKRDFRASVKKAAEFVAFCVQVSETAGSPLREGVLLERCLPRLLQP